MIIYPIDGVLIVTNFRDAKAVMVIFAEGILLLLVNIVVIYWKPFGDNIRGMKMSEEVKGIYKKMLAVMKDVGYLQKDDTISYGTTNYKGLSEEKITGVVREKLVKHGIIVYPIVQSHKREGNLSTVDTTYRFVDTDDGSYIDAVSSGTGADTQDKGVGKAMTYSFKYLFLRTFAIPTGEDPDKISSAELDDKEKAHRVTKGRTAILQLFEDHPELSEDYKTTITMDVDLAVQKEDVGTMEIIYKEVRAEIKRTNASENKAKTNASFTKAAKLAAKHNEEPPLPDTEPDPPGLFDDEKEIF